MRRLPLLFVLAVLATGCGLEASEPSSQPPTTSVPRVRYLSKAVAQAAQVTIPVLEQNSVRRQAEEMTVRVRNTGCAGVSLGSGIAIAPDVLITNRHVLAGASELEVNTWDGRDLTVTAAAVGVLGDLGVAKVNGTLPTVARFGPPPHADEVVTVVGYPLGGPLTLADGTVVDRIDGTTYGVQGPIIRLTAEVEHGNSGGPVIDSSGRVVAIVYAIETTTGFGLAIPVDTLAALARAGGMQAVPPCGSG
jgi:S1-C subfamily serine protease